ncbi:DUF948 domain-containing protein [Cutibacterium sp. WCA-380-WT-3A]|uniref:DUF948 domain-containing protein n=1 Tax=Cutibacterium porci TaxID=2605781 RepID=A0A7K0J6N0_9ACTN|nr:DUF948 domain-containing protein [Cutibacterium porci]MSS45483.1 DUF948 domain-containing protein [Cutibacterium porci]
MTLGQIAGLIAALAAVVLVALCAIPLLKLGGVLDEVRKTVRDVDESTVPILEELKGTVVITNGEISKLDQVIEDIHTISEHGTVVTGQAAELAQTFTQTVGTPMVKAAAFGEGVRRTIRRPRRRARQSHVENAHHHQVGPNVTAAEDGPDQN